MNLADILSPAQIISEMQASNRWEAIDELINHLVVTGKIKSDNRDQIAAVVKKRETSMSTGIGFGIGIPHASTDLIYEVVGAFGRSQKGINFGAPDESAPGCRGSSGEARGGGMVRKARVGRSGVYQLPAQNIRRRAEPRCG